MSSYNGYHPPPPPSPAPAHGNFQQRRERRPEPPSLSTNFLRLQGASPPLPLPGPGGSSAGNTPFPFSPATPSALGPSSLHAGLPAARSPMEPYNPRQWGQRQVSGSQMVFGRSGSSGTPSTREVTGMEDAMPSPPPPYSPDSPAGASQRGQRASPLYDHAGFTTSPPPVDSSRGSPQVPMSPAFPPPPGQSSRHRERSASGLAGPRAFLSGLRGKQTANNAEVQAPQPVSAVPAPPQPQFIEPRPPAARRAASTGQIALSQSPAPGPSERSTPESRWQPGMPLPPPPPGPPPPGTRSQSLNRYAPSSSIRSNSQSSEHGVQAQHARHAAATSNLGPIPPTPADWVEGQETHPATQDISPEPQVFDSEPQWPPLRIDTGTRRDTSITRRPATRESSTSGLRERRSRSRRGKEREGTELFSPASDNTRVSEQIWPAASGSISRRREHTRNISGFAQPSPKTTDNQQSRSVQQGPPSAGAAATVLTPPYTPAVKGESYPLVGPGLKVPGSASSDRPISHLLHTPNEDTSGLAPLTPGRPASAGSVKTSTKLDVFALQAMERHRAFVEKEVVATSDEERLELFANFMVHESRVRRDRYATAYNAMAGDILDLTRDMWRSYTRASKRAVTPSTSMSSFDHTVPSWASDGQPASAHGMMPSSASSFGDYTPATDVGSIGDEALERAESRQWAETFKPSLSPIQSVAQSTLIDEDSSRGRAPSRWWESNSGSGSVGRPDRIQRSHRETKYMGVRASQLQEEAEPSPAVSGQSNTPSASMQSFRHSGSEYPPEKVGWHEGEGDYDTPMATPANAAGVRERKVSTPGLEPLNVSRLVTLPPPYPRHHPAVNNNHPLLAELRSEHRELCDHSDIQHIKDSFLDQDYTIQQGQREEAKRRRAKLRLSIQSKIADGSLSFAEAAQAEKEFDTEEAGRGKANARANFDVFETQVAQPLNELLTNKIEKATACVGQLRTELSFGNQASDPNQAQEEGDEQPERLEKLTLLKWLFEAREQLYKEMFDLHAMRAEKYSEVILTPYRIQKAQAKIDEATSFFAKDTRDRQTAFAKDSNKRLQDLQQVMDRNVSRGVEDQLSAFWDIAPHLMEIITRLPPDLHGFEVHIPAQEYEENPSYQRYPMQYLYSLLSHAEKSAYQFIESQTNLLCLLHEVRTAASKGQLRLMEIEGGEVGQARADAGMRLDGDLKEKVGEVESQWREALGDGLEECKERVREFLEESGGWEDGLEG